MDDYLHVRLKSCLQTILDLEPQLEVLDKSVVLKADLFRLKRYMRQVDSMNLEEEDVFRLERVTEHFLCALRDPVQRAVQGSHDNRNPRILQ